MAEAPRDPARSDAERFDAVRRVFLAALEREGDAREAFLAEACAGDPELLGEVRALLDEERAADPRLERPAVESLLGAWSSGAELPETIGEFRVLGVLGTGGMGVVYEAEQPSPRRRVALKVVRSPFVTDEDLRRFEHEARALGWLSHPGIATIHAAGVADAGHGPQPWLAMELVRGERLDAWAERAGLGTRERLELFALVCDAVHHAHQKGVVHRDLKPGNVLVDGEGRPKVLDFGVARLTGGDLDATARTSAGQILGTLPYMSPEQVRGDPSQVDVRSDVYALGVIGYELLARRRPLDVSSRELPEAIRAIAHDEPVPLGQLDRRLRGDVETIVAKAMEKERERRYASAAELAADVRRHLANEPILARPASRSYQIRKFARRNRALVGGLAAVFLVLLVGAVTATVLWLEKEEQRAAAERRGEELARALATAEANLERAVRAEASARDEERRARTEADTARAVTDYLVSLFEQANPEHGRVRDLTAVEMLDQGLERIQGRFLDRPEVRAHLLAVLGRIHNWLQRYDRSRPILEEALALTAEVHGEESAEYADVLERLAQVHMEEGDLATAEAMRRRVLALRRGLLGPEHRLVADALTNLANVLQARGAWDEARARYEEARALGPRTGAELGPMLARIDHNLGSLAVRQGRYGEAEELLRASLEAFAEHHGEDHWRTLMTRAALAEGLRSSGDPRRMQEALGEARRAYEGLRELFGETNRMVRIAKTTWASCLRDAGDPIAAADVLAELAWRHGEEHGKDADYARILLPLARTLQDAGRPDEAEATYAELLHVLEGVDDALDGMAATARHNLALLVRDAGRLDEALALEREALRAREADYGPAHPFTLSSYDGLARIHRLRGDAAGEEALLRRALAALEAAEGAGAPEAAAARSELAAFLRRHGREAEAAALTARDGAPGGGE